MEVKASSIGRAQTLDWRYAKKDVEDVYLGAERETKG